MTNRLESLGIRFLRFYDIDVKKNMNGVLSTIENWILNKTNKEYHETNIFHLIFS